MTSHSRRLAERHSFPDVERPVKTEQVVVGSHPESDAQRTPPN